MSGHWVLVESDAPTASHDEQTFQKTAGFPTAASGGTINDRDYEHDFAARQAVVDIGSNYDARALSLDSPVVVSSDGIVISGNNRTMSSKIAAKKGTDAKYVDALKRKAKKLGFDSADIDKFSHPRAVFLADGENEYSTAQFAKYNQSTTKAQSPVDKGIKVGKTVTPKFVAAIASHIGDFETLGDVYANSRACGRIFDEFVDAGLLQRMDLPQYFADDHITGAGKEFLETALLGSVIDEGNLRALNGDGMKQYRQKLVRAILPLSQNKSFKKQYSLTDNINEAISLISSAKAFLKPEQQTDKNIIQYAESDVLPGFGEKASEVTVEMVKKLLLTQKEFADFMKRANAALADGSDGTMNIILGRVETPEEVLAQVFGRQIKKALAALRSLAASLRKNA